MISVFVNFLKLIVFFSNGARDVLGGAQLAQRTIIEEGSSTPRRAYFRKGTQLLYFFFDLIFFSIMHPKLVDRFFQTFSLPKHFPSGGHYETENMS
jgi:hypothetical protein